LVLFNIRVHSGLDTALPAVFRFPWFCFSPKKIQIGWLVCNYCQVC
jgi:hypothetical protein